MIMIVKKNQHCFDFYPTLGQNLNIFINYCVNFRVLVQVMIHLFMIYSWVSIAYQRITDRRNEFPF